jgi:hypothetical protein
LMAMPYSSVDRWDIKSNSKSLRKVRGPSQTLAQNRTGFRLPNRPEIGEMWRVGAQKKNTVCGVVRHVLSTSSHGGLFKVSTVHHKC